MALPQTVSPGQLITAELINDILAALRDYQSLHTSFTTSINRLNGAVRDLDERCDQIEQRMAKVELRVMRDTDPLELVPGLTMEYVNLLRGGGITKVSELKARAADVP